MISNEAYSFILDINSLFCFILSLFISRKFMKAVEMDVSQYTFQSMHIYYKTGSNLLASVCLAFSSPGLWLMWAYVMALGRAVCGVRCAVCG